MCMPKEIRITLCSSNGTNPKLFNSLAALLIQWHVPVVNFEAVDPEAGGVESSAGWPPRRALRIPASGLTSGLHLTSGKGHSHLVVP